MNAAAIAVGAALVLAMLIDSFDTLLATSIRRRRFSLSHWYYRKTWTAYRAVCLRITNPARREAWLARFGPASFVGLLTLWALIEIIGGGLIWWGFRDSFDASIVDLADSIYYSGVVYFSIGFGDITPAGDGMRFLTVLEGFVGLGTLGMVIGYLPTLTSSYAARERQLLRLDDLTDARITPVSLIQSYVGTDGDVTRLNAMFDEWAAWCTETYDSHTSLPTLLWFRSKHPGQSWITALGVVTDAARAYAAAVPDQVDGSAVRLHRQAVRLVTDLADRIGLEPKPTTTLSLRGWSIGYSLMQATNLPLRSFEDSWGRVQTMHQDFGPYMEAFIDELVAPRGFWGVTSSDHMAEVEFFLAVENDDADPAPF